MTSAKLIVVLVEAILKRTAVQGFPIISGDDQRMLEGYIGRTEVEYVLGASNPMITYGQSLTELLPEKSRRTRDVSPQTSCSFVSERTEHDDPHLSATGTGPALGIDEDEAEDLIETSASETVINMWPWVNQVGALGSYCDLYYGSYMILLDALDRLPSTSSRNSDAAVQTNGVSTLLVYALGPFHLLIHFSIAGRPRVILVEEHGSLVGLITVKDVLKFIATERGTPTPSWNDRRGLDGLLEEVWIWISHLVERGVDWSRNLLRR
jgi:chloride channel 3/4/5